VPQPLSYLVEDVARRYGRVRVGAAPSLLTCDDPALLDQILAEPAVVAHSPRRVAPTVATLMASPSAALDVLRSVGLHPSADGVDAGGGAHAHVRAPSRGRPRPLRSDRPAPSEGTLEAAVRAIRAGDRGTQSRPPVVSSGLRSSASTDVLDALARAIDAGASVWIGYVDNHGTSTERVIDPISLDAGWLSAFDQRSDQVRTFAVHRITGVAALGPAAARADSTG
jgi:hypothetical protein